MQVSKSNDVKIYNLSAGKSVPQWLSERKRRNLEKKDIDVRRRIQLIQDFEMPCVSNAIAITPDQQYVMAAGNYKPILRCYDVNDMSLKFERGLDADVIKILPLSEDFSKICLLEQDRYLEFHARFGNYFRVRIPKHGRDMSLCTETSDLFVVGNGSQIQRLNLEVGQLAAPLKTEAEDSNCCEFNPHHQLFVCGTSETTVEAWDYRSNTRIGILDCAVEELNEEAAIANEKPSVTSVKFKDALNLAVGTSTGHVLLYDIRSTKPRLVKDHNLGLPITKIDYAENTNLVLSMDERVLKMWNEADGKPFAAIEPGTKLTQFDRYPSSGLIFFANDAPKMLQYFVPALGPSPKWCYFLDSITEELEESDQPAVYDDYKFLTKEQLEELGLEQLIGTNYLRAYMHGYFIDIRLYNKAKTLTQPFAFENYKAKKAAKKAPKPRIEDERFAALFTDPDYKIINDLNLNDKRKQKQAADEVDEEQTVDQADEEELVSGEEMDSEVDEEESEREPSPPPKQKQERQPRKQNFKLVGLESRRDFQSFAPNDDYSQGMPKKNSGTLGQRRKQLGNFDKQVVVEDTPFGGKSATFTLKADPKQAKSKRREQKVKEHLKERKEMLIKLPEITIYESGPSQSDVAELPVEETKPTDDSVEIIEADFKNIVQKFNRVLLLIDESNGDLPQLRVKPNVVEFEETATETLKRLQSEFEDLEQEFSKENDGLEQEHVDFLKQMLEEAKDKLLASTSINPTLNSEEIFFDSRSDLIGDQKPSSGYVASDLSKMSERLLEISNVIGQPSDPSKRFAQPLDFVVEELALQLDAVPSNSQSNSNDLLKVVLAELANQKKDDNANKINEIYDTLIRWNSECQSLPLVLERLRHCAALSEQAQHLLKNKLEILTSAETIEKSLDSLSGVNKRVEKTKKELTELKKKVGKS
ncbi:Nucleolar protein 10 [Aphelenchoides bicaudatus]|nr:Nucleolar protein 10 [Aphelenchoides bicaudatus]